MQRKLKDLFNLNNVPDTIVVDVPEKLEGVSQGAYPSIKADYIFQPTLLKKMLRFFQGNPARKNLLLVGDTGVGKSSLVEQVAARLGHPVFSIACSGKMRLAHFVGSYTLKDGNTVWRDGPLLLAMRHDGIFLADEITRLDHSEQMALAKVLDEGVLTVPETGEIVVAGDKFRFIGTGNSAGYGDASGAYSGERVSSAAFLDRFQKYQVDYLSQDQEVELISKITRGNLPEQVAKKMVEFAFHVRKNFVARGGDLRVVMSTRNLCVWALETMDYRSISKEPMKEALKDTVLNGAPESDAAVLSELWGTWIDGALRPD